MHGLRWMRRRRVRACGWMLLTAYCAYAAAAPPAGAVGSRVLRVADAIETTRAMVDRDLNAIFPSPDGRRYALMLVSGDVTHDRVIARLLVGRYDAIEPPRQIAALSTRGLAAYADAPTGSYELTLPGLNPPRWLDDAQLALLWDDERGVRQVITVDADAGVVRRLTHHATDVLYFSVASANALVLYGAIKPCEPSAQAQTAGVVVDAPTAWFRLDECEYFRRRDHELFVQNGRGEPRRVAGSPINRFVAVGAPPPVLSPDGRYAIAWLSVSVDEIDPAWTQYADRVLVDMVRESAFGAGTLAARQLRRLALIDLERAEATMLLAAPAPLRRPLVAWSSDARSVAIGRTYVPLRGGPDEAAIAGLAFVDIDIATRDVRRIDLSLAHAREATTLRWRGADRLIVGLASGAAVELRRVGGRWAEVGGVAVRPDMPARSFAIQLRQGLNSPPVLTAIDARRGRERVLLDLNPQLSQFALGRVEWLTVATPGGVWEGRLHHPVGAYDERPAPLVVQTHTHASRDEFSLSGKGGTQPALGPGVSAYIAQPLAAAGLYVLHGGLADEDTASDGVDVTRRRIAALEHVIDVLVDRGLVDRTRVGLMGFSASGWLVSYAIAHSTFPYAAALTDDNKDGGYLQASLAGWPAGLAENLIGAPAFADGLEVWLRESPALNAHRIRAPLLLTISSPGMELCAWDMYSRLRRLQQPVELFLTPQFRRGAHNLQNPAQLRALQERAFDWWRFWLQGEEDRDPSKLAQYDAWRALRMSGARRPP